MALEELTDRERQVFTSIVQCFIETAEPVGSRYLSKKCNLNISPATIRNVMMDLEEKGLICQPYASAGRVPTNIGYRIFVDGLMKSTKLNLLERRSILTQLSDLSEDVDLIVEKASHVLSNISSQLGVVLAPRFSQGRLEKIDFVSVTNNKFLIVLSIKSGFVKTIIVEMEKEVPFRLLDEMKHVLNERLNGLTIAEIQKSFDQRFADLDDDRKTFLNVIKNKSEKLIAIDGPLDYHIAGASKVIQQPEFASQNKMEIILDLFDRRDLLLKIIHEQEGEGVSIVIGEENKEELMKNCSVITTTYHVDNAIGTIGIIGPTRMQYGKIIGLVQFMAETLGYLISKQK